MLDIKNTFTWQGILILWEGMKDFLTTLGNVGKDFNNVFYYIFRLKINYKATLEQASRFAVDSLPITLTIVGMTSIIISMQISPELAKQGGADYIGSLSALVMIRELGAVMTGFAIISMVGSSFASEIATLVVTEQVDAMKALNVDPIEYIIVPRVIAGFVMMPFVIIISSFFGLVCAGVIANWTADLSYLNYCTSVWNGLFIKDIFVALLKASFFGGTIALISCSTGYAARGGAKEVGLATTKAVVWSFLAIAVWDYVFASVFYL